MTKSTMTLKFIGLKTSDLLNDSIVYLDLFSPVHSNRYGKTTMSEYAKTLGMDNIEFITAISNPELLQEFVIENMCGSHDINEAGFERGYYVLENGKAVNKKFEDLGIVGIVPKTIINEASYGEDHWGEEAVAARKYWSELCNDAYNLRDRRANKIRFERNLGYEITEEAAAFLRKNSSYNKNYFSSEIPARLIMKSNEYKSGKKKAMYLSLADQYKNWAMGNSEYNMPWSMKQAKMAYEIAFPQIR
jgi:hypothetical protein